MRLLYVDNEAQVRLKEFQDSEVPRYAILSHLSDTKYPDQVTLQDIENGSWRRKSGHRKIDFVLQQAQNDGLKYCWIDFCCIDFSRSAEIPEMVNSMLRWYREAQTCYVYLDDIRLNGGDFTSSKWFTLGWTFQELLASRVVKFFDADGIYITRKGSSLSQINTVTEIPIPTLEGAPLSDFSVEERLSGMDKRFTTYAENRAYALMGNFDVNMPLIGGEGSSPMERLREEIDRSVSRDLRPRRIYEFPSDREQTDSRTRTGSNGQASTENERQVTVGTEQGVSTPPSHAHTDTPVRQPRPGAQQGSSTQLFLPYLKQKPCRLYRALLVAVVVVSFTVSVCYTIVKNDASSGFTIGAFVLAAGGILVNERRTRHERVCKCYNELETAASLTLST